MGRATGITAAKPGIARELRKQQIILQREIAELEK